MKKLIVSGVMLLLIACAVAPALSPLPADEAGWVPLFNGHNFDGWYTFLPSTGKNKDPKGVFKVEKGMIHVFDIPVTNEKQEFGYLATNQELSHCRIRAEFKFGEKRFVPRQEDKRDSGLLYYFVGPDKVWPRSLECQIQETDVGDLWILDGPSITTKIETPDYPVYSTGPLLTKNKGPHHQVRRFRGTRQLEHSRSDPRRRQDYASGQRTNGDESVGSETARSARCDEDDSAGSRTRHAASRGRGDLVSQRAHETAELAIVS